MKENKKTFTLGITCVMITATLLIAGLWPFNFIPGNKAEWLQNGNGIQFYDQGIVYSQEPLTVQESAESNASITIELLIHPYEEYRNRVPSILTLYDHNIERFILGQWKTALVIRIPAAKKTGSAKRYYEIGLSNVLERDVPHLITVTSREEITNIYVDGKLEKIFSHYTLMPENHGLSGYLILGNSSEGTHPWKGAFLGLAIYDHTLNSTEVLDHNNAWQKGGQPLLSREKKPIALYLFDEHGGEQIRDQSGHRNHLWIPATFHPLRRTILALPQKAYWSSSSNLTDISINILGFMPFGVFFSAWFRRAKNLSVQRSCCITILLGFCISLGIELAQVYLPTRDSSLVDVISNTMGTAVGVLLLKYVLSVLHKIRVDRMLN